MTMMRNGVDMEKVNTLTEVLREDPAGGRKTLSGITTWNGGAHSTTIVRNFVVPADEPVVLGGTDRGASPMELVLIALSACMATAIAYSAAEEGIEVDAIEIDAEGDLDLGGFFEVRRSGERLSVGCEGSEPEHEHRPGARQEFEKPARFRGTELEKTEGLRARRAEGPGFREVRLTVRVDADASRKKVEELVDRGYRRSPVVGSLEGRVPIRVCIGREDTGAG